MHSFNFFNFITFSFSLEVDEIEGFDDAFSGFTGASNGVHFPRHFRIDRCFANIQLLRSDLLRSSVNSLVPLRLPSHVLR